MRKSKRKQPRIRKRAAALCLAGVLAVSLAGCGGSSGEKRGGQDWAGSQSGGMHPMMA